MYCSIMGVTHTAAPVNNLAVIVCKRNSTRPCMCLISARTFPPKPQRAGINNKGGATRRVAPTIGYFPSLARSSSITLSSNFLNSGPGWLSFVPGLSSLGLHRLSPAHPPPPRAVSR
jgi:hypothetical protein